MKSGLAFLLFPLLLVGVAYAQTPADAAQALEQQFGHTALALRGLYWDSNLHFASDGSLIGKAETAFAVSDARFDLQHAEIKGKKLILHGDLPTAFAGKDGEVSYHVGWISRTVEIDLNDTALPSVLAVLWKVFYQPAETIPGTCTKEEMLQQAERKSKAEGHQDDPLAFGERGAEITTCRANGDKLVSPSVRRRGPLKAPVATYDPEPAYPANEKNGGIVIVQLVVDPKGHASSIIVERPLGHGFDEAAVQAVHGWKFAPATREGEPVPVIVNVEVNFHKG